MTREEEKRRREIQEAAEDYSAYIDGTDEERYNSTELEAFKAGAEWADDTSAKSTDKKSVASSNEVWLARSEDGRCRLHLGTEPKKTGAGYFCGSHELIDYDNLFPSVTYENSPKKAKLTIIVELEE